MAFNLNTFKSNFNGGARPNLFEVSIDFPQFSLPSDLADNTFSKKIYLAKAAFLPASTLGFIEVPYFGRQVKVAGDRTFTEYTITFINDEDFHIRDAMEKWMNAINQHQENYSTTNDYQKDITIKQYGRGGDGSTPPVLKEYKLINAFPIEVSEISLAWDDNDTIEEFDVTIAYDYWISSDPTDITT